MTTDIHALDQYIGQYVSISEGAEGAAGFIVDVADKVDYEGGAHRWVTLDWGQGWPVRATTEIVPTQPLEGAIPPAVENPIQIIHGQMDGKPCSNPDCPNKERAPKAMRALRAWQARQNDQYWVHHYVNKLKGLLDDPVSVGELIRDARCENAPPHIVERMESLADWHAKAGQT